MTPPVRAIVGAAETGASGVFPVKAHRIRLAIQFTVRHSRLTPMCHPWLGSFPRIGPLLLVWLVARPGLAADIPSATDACLKGLAETTPSTEFVLLEEGAVVRHERTTLEWQRCALGQRWVAKSRGCEGRPASHTWSKASQLAEEKEDGWRLPTGKELLTIVEKCHYSPAINPQVFPNTPSGFFWSSSEDTGGLDRAWSLSFFSGQYYRANKTQAGRIRLVRGTLRETPPP